MQSFIELIQTGGPVMYPLSLIGLLILFRGFYQSYWLAVWRTFPGKYACSGAPRWAGKALNVARSKKGFHGLGLMESIEICLARTEDCLTRTVPSMRFMAQISTLFGFLGTVMGMVRVFNTVATLEFVSPSDLAGGIHEALFTTVYGLILAIIAWGFVYIIEALARRQLRRIELQILELLDGDHNPAGAANDNQAKK